VLDRGRALRALVGAGEVMTACWTGAERYEPWWALASAADPVLVPFMGSAFVPVGIGCLSGNAGSPPRILVMGSAYR